jgi:hypothetical protein
MIGGITQLLALLTLLFGIPVAILLFSFAAKDGRKRWFAHWTYAVGAVSGALIFVAIGYGAYPLTSAAFTSCIEWIDHIARKSAGPAGVNWFVGLAGALIPMVHWYLGMAAGI